MSQITKVRGLERRVKELRMIEKIEEEKSGIIFKFPNFDYEPTKEELNIKEIADENADDSDEEIQEIEQQNRENKEFLEGLEQ